MNTTKNLWDRVQEYIKHRNDAKKLNTTKRIYIDTLQLAINKILPNPDKISTGLERKPPQYFIEIDNYNYIPEKCQESNIFYDSEHLKDAIEKYENLDIIIADYMLLIEVDEVEKLDANSKIQKTLEIKLYDRRMKHEQKFPVHSEEDYKNAKEEICKYIKNGKGSWVYTPVQGKLFD
ncbi:MAG: hypothetical protein ACP5N1_03115 [Candidatus Woesearchaeota archaeon]